MVVVRLDEIWPPKVEIPASSSKDDAPDDDEMLVTFTGDRSNLREAYRKLWAAVLMMALRDKAASVHYHPWRDGGALAYICENVRYEMVPPPAEYAGVCIDVARTLFTQPRRSGFLSRLRQQRSENTVCSAMRVEFAGWASLWDAVCWSSGERAGVDLFLIRPFM